MRYSASATVFSRQLSSFLRIPCAGHHQTLSRSIPFAKSTEWSTVRALSAGSRYALKSAASSCTSGHFRRVARNRPRKYARSLSSSMPADEWPQHEYYAVANATLDAIYEAVVSAGETNAFGPDFDAELSSGVVRLFLGDENGTYVANTQTPNRQIWLSSPVSGPWRYDWHIKDRVWRSTRDGHVLTELLEKELSEIAGKPVPMHDPHA